MTTAGALVQAAFREGNLIPIAQAPTPNESAEGLDVLNRFVLSTFGTYVGNRLVDWPAPRVQRTGSVDQQYPLRPGAAWERTPLFVDYLPASHRLVWDGSARTVYFPAEPQDGALVGAVAGSGARADALGALTLDGNGRLIDGAATVTVADRESLTPTAWFYRADLGTWREVRAMAADEESLFPVELDDLWICGASVRLAPRYDKQVSPATISRGGEMMNIFKARYAQTAQAPSGGDLLIPGYESYARYDGWMR